MTKLDYCSFPVVRNCVTFNLRSFNINANLLIYLSKSCSWFSITPLTVALNQKEFANSKRLQNARSALISRQLVRVTCSFPQRLLSKVMPRYLSKSLFSTRSHQYTPLVSPNLLHVCDQKTSHLEKDNKMHAVLLFRDNLSGLSFTKEYFYM